MVFFHTVVDSNRSEYIIIQSVTLLERWREILWGHATIMWRPIFYISILKQNKPFQTQSSAWFFFLAISFSILFFSHFPFDLTFFFFFLLHHHFLIHLLAHLSIIPSPPPLRPRALTEPGRSSAAATAVRRLRQRLSVTPTGSQRCLAVVLAPEWRVHSARRTGDTLTPWLLPRFALSRAKVTTEAPSSLLPAPPGHQGYCCNGRH